MSVSTEKGSASWYFDIFIITLIVLNVLAIILESVVSLHERFSDVFYTVEIISVAVFTIEYLLRVWTADLDPAYNKPVSGNIKYALTPMAIIDLLAVLPYVEMAGFWEQIALPMLACTFFTVLPSWLGNRSTIVWLAVGGGTGNLVRREVSGGGLLHFTISSLIFLPAIALLALDGKLSLDDDVRKYIPEVPQYEKPVLIRHMLNHTSGIPNYNSVPGLMKKEMAGIEAEDVFNIVRNSPANFKVGERWEYSNTNYFLLGLVIFTIGSLLCGVARLTRLRTRSGRA